MAVHILYMTVRLVHAVELANINIIPVCVMTTNNDFPPRSEEAASATVQCYVALYTAYDDGDFSSFTVFPTAQMTVRNVKYQLSVRALFDLCSQKTFIIKYLAT